MSQDWIKLEKITLEKKEVARIATALKMDRYAVVGRLARLWTYFDSHTEDGRMEGIDYQFLDDLVGKKDFCAAMETQDWIASDDTSVWLPNFDRHNGETAKLRAENARRQAKCRAKPTRKSQKNVTHVTENCDQKRDQRRGEENRGEEKRGESPTEIDPPRNGFDQATDLAQRLAFDGGEGTSLTATARWRAVVVDLLGAGATYEQIEAERTRKGRVKSEHPGDFRRRMMKGGADNDDQRAYEKRVAEQDAEMRKLLGITA